MTYGKSLSQNPVKDCASGLHFKPVVLIWFFLNLCAQVHTCMQRLKGSLRCYPRKHHLFPFEIGPLTDLELRNQARLAEHSLGDPSVSAFQLRIYKHGPLYLPLHDRLMVTLDNVPLAGHT